MPKYCPTCNRSSDELRFYGEFCNDCAGKRLMASLNSRPIEVLRCKTCGRVKLRGQYVNGDPRALEELIARKFSGYKVHLLSHDKYNATVEIAEESEGGVIAVIKHLDIGYKKVLCDRCYKKASDYHEAVVQLRGNMEKIQRTAGRITKYFERHGEFVSKVEEKDRGINMHLSSKKLASEFMADAKLHPVTSYTLAGLKNGKRVYMNTYALHFQ